MKKLPVSKLMIPPVMILSLSLLSGCAHENRPVPWVKHKTQQAVEFVGIGMGTTMKKPDYYANGFYPENYSFGKKYYLDEMSCWRHPELCN